MGVEMPRRRAPPVEGRARNAGVGGGLRGERPEPEGERELPLDVRGETRRQPAGGDARAARRALLGATGRPRPPVLVVAPLELPVLGKAAFEEVRRRAPLAGADGALEAAVERKRALGPRRLHRRDELLEAGTPIEAAALGEPALDRRGVRPRRGGPRRAEKPPRAG